LTLTTVADSETYGVGGGYTTVGEGARLVGVRVAAAAAMTGAPGVKPAAAVENMAGKISETTRATGVMRR
jgi:hypothetical protein